VSAIKAEPFDIAIVGAGLGGLATGAMLSRLGHRVLMVERHNVPGGYASNFQRAGFTFDVSLHSADGMTDGADSFETIRACGVANKVRFLPHRKLYRYKSGDIDLSVRERDLPAYKRQLAALFPGEGANIDALFKEAGRTYADLSGFLYARMPYALRLLATPFLYPRILRYGKTTVDQFFSRFTGNERLKSVLSAQWTYYGLPPKQLAFPYFSYPFTDYLRNGGYSIEGGSQKLSDALVDVIESHGGQVILSSPVTAIHVERGRVRGFTSKKTGRVDVDRLISGISPDAVRELVGAGAFSSKWLARLATTKHSISAFQIYLGLDCPLHVLGVPEDEYIVFHADNPDLCDQYAQMQAGQVHTERTGWSMNFFSNVDPSLAPAGKSTLGIFTLLGSNGWHELSKPAYREKKRALVEAMLAKAEQALPGLRAHIQVCEAGTPGTLRKFTANPLGAIYGFEQTPQQSGLLHRFAQRYPIRGLYQVGAWTFPGAGFIGTLLSARALVDRYFGGLRLNRLTDADRARAPARVAPAQADRPASHAGVPQPNPRLNP
jgi:prolycopene isomerase